MTRQSKTPAVPSRGANDPCGELSVEADRRMAAATDAREAEAGLAARLVAARAELEKLAVAEEEAAGAAGPDQLEALRDRARETFQAAATAARTPDEIGEAGSAWLVEVDRLTDLAAASHARHERARADVLIATAVVEHLTAEADAARLYAESAESAAVDARGRAETCIAEAAARAAAERAEAARAEAERTAAEAERAAAAVAERAAARQAAAEAQAAQRAAAEAPAAQTAAQQVAAEQRTDDQAEGRAAEPSARAPEPDTAPRAPEPGIVAEAAASTAGGPTGGRALGLPSGAADADQDPAPDDGGRLTPRSILSRILAGEVDHLDDLASRIAPDPVETGHWRELLSELCEALLHRAIDAGALAVPVTHDFWGAFTPEQARDILSALAALGFRTDGLGGWQDERIPSQREISIAVAHAGLDPMRIRHWPTQTEAVALVRDAQVLGGEYVSAVAPGLGARELRLILGAESRRFAELWDAWTHIRPILLEAAMERGTGRGS